MQSAFNSNIWRVRTSSNNLCYGTVCYLLGINPARVCAAGRVRVLCAASRECVEPSGPWRVACVRARASRRVRARAHTGTA